jgi:IS4 transposase
MVFDQVFQPFIEESAVSVMFRGTLENIFAADRLDRIFESNCVRQRAGELLFSTCADLLSLVVLGARKSLNAAYVARKDHLKVSVKSIYDKVAGIEPIVSEQLVRQTAVDLVQLVDELGGTVKGPLPGYDVRILDGNHLAGTDHRIAELRRLGAAALPGQAIAVLDPRRRLLLDVIACEDGHANERTLIPSVLERVQEHQCWIGDSLFCTFDLIFGMRARKAYFLVRQHGQVEGELQGKRKKKGRGSTGVVYEQPLLLRRQDGTVTTVRRITIVRDKPTSKGEKEVHLLTNLPDKVSAVQAAEAYLDRWSIETAFQDLATTLRSEINTLGYPRAALFGFCLALLMFNVMSVVKAALRGALQGKAKQEKKISSYYLADEVSGVWRGMAIAIPDKHWEEAFATLTPTQLAAKLRWLTRKVNLSAFYTNPWTPKKPQPKRISGNRGNHVATYKILQQRTKQKKKELVQAIQ